MSTLPAALARLLALTLTVVGLGILMPAPAQAAPGVTTSANHLAFGPADPWGPPVGASVDVINSGTTDVVIAPASITGADRVYFFVEDDDCSTDQGGPGLLHPGERCTLDLGFYPFFQPATRQAVLSVPTSLGTSVTVSLTGTTPMPGISSYGPGTFGKPSIGAASTADVTVFSTGEYPLDTEAATITGPDADEFEVIEDRCAGGFFPTGETCLIRVRFRPTSNSSKSATLRIPSNVGSDHLVALHASTGEPDFDVSPASVTMPSTPVGAFAETSLTVTNSGSGNPWLLFAPLSGPDADQFSVYNLCAQEGPIGAGESCTVRVYFSPTTSGPKSAQLTIDAGNGDPVVVPLSGTAAPPTPVASVTPSSLTFGSRLVDTVSSTQSIAVTNTGNSPLTVELTAPVTGANAADFGTQVDCPEPLLPSASCAVRVYFRPTAAGSRTATVTITSNGGSRAVSVSGSGIAPTPGIALSPGTLAFGQQLVPLSTGTLTATVQNTGTSSLTLGTPSVTGASAAEFSISSSTCSGATVSPGASCTVGVRFTPASPGSKTAALSIPSNAAGSPHAVALTGTGLRGVATVSTTALDFHAQRVASGSPTQAVTVTNTGNQNLAVGTVALDGANPGDFSVTGNTCSGSTLPPGGSCTVTSRFSPTGRGARSARIVIPHNAGTSKVVTLSGLGLAAVATIDTGTLAFGSTDVGAVSGPRTATITNEGDAPLTIGSIVSSGPAAGQFQTTLNTCTGATIAPGAACALTLRLAPTSAGWKTATVTVNHDAGAPTTLTLEGTGLQAVPSISPASKAFGSQVVGHPSAPFGFGITNLGNGPLYLNDLTFGGNDPASFEVAGTTCTGPMEQGESCVVSVRFNPSSIGAKSATLAVAHNGSASPTVLNLTGSGTAPIINVSPTALAFGDQWAGDTSAARTLTISNTGSAALHVSATAIGGPDAGAFAVSADSCTGVTVGIGAQCTIRVTFTPPEAGPASASLTLAHDAAGSSSTVPLTGNGIYPHPQVSTTGVDFGTVDRATSSPSTTITLSNTGNANLAVGTVGVVGTDASSYAITADACGGTAVAPAGSCDISVRFSPTTVGAKAADLRILTNAGAPTFVSLSGVSVPKADLKVLGIGSIYTGRDHLVTRTVASSGTLLKHKLGVVNEDSLAQSFKIGLTSSGAASTAQVWTRGTGAHPLATDGAGNFVTPSIPAGKTVLYDLRVTPTAPGQVTSVVDAELLASTGDLIEGLTTATNTAAPSAGTSGFELFATQGTQPMIGGPVSGQTVTGPALGLEKSATYKVRLKNDSGASTRIGLRLTTMLGCGFTATVKVGTTVITAAAFAGTYLTPLLGPGKYKDVKVIVKRATAGCGATIIRARSLDDDTVVRTSFLLANAAYDPAVD